MRCKNCQYPLWNIAARACPECGTGFAPSHFEFNVNSVQFRCPHCAQSYYGTGARGHLVPREFDCVSCGKRVDMDEMVLCPTEGVDERLTETDANPWVDRARVGRWSGYWRTFGRAISGPGRLIEVTPVESGGAIGFGAITLVWIGLLGTVGCGWLMAGAALGGGRGGMPASMIAGAAVSTLFSTLVAMVWGLAAHGVLVVISPKGKEGEPSRTLGRTMQAVFYSSPTFFLAGVPCLGPIYLLLPALIWWVVVATVMVSRGQRVGGGRATLAVALPPALVVAGILGLAAYSFSQAMTVATAAGAKMGATASAANDQKQATDLAAALTAPRFEGGKRVWVEHVAWLVADGSVGSDGFKVQRSNQPSVAKSVLCGMETLDFWMLDDADQRERIVKEMQGLKGKAAYRVGDYVFTHLGFEADKAADPGLWIFVQWPDPKDTKPDADWMMATPGGVVPGRARYRVAWSGGRVGEVAAEDVDRLLREQNELRTRLGLPELPHPRDVGQ